LPGRTAFPPITDEFLAEPHLHQNITETFEASITATPSIREATTLSGFVGHHPCKDCTELTGKHLLDFVTLETEH
jgi:hypothetical protein